MCPFASWTRSLPASAWHERELRRLGDRENEPEQDGEREQRDGGGPGREAEHERDQRTDRGDRGEQTRRLDAVDEHAGEARGATDGPNRQAQSSATTTPSEVRSLICSPSATIATQSPKAERPTAEATRRKSRPRSRLGGRSPAVPARDLRSRRPIPLTLRSPAAALPVGSATPRAGRVLADTGIVASR